MLAYALAICVLVGCISFASAATTGNYLGYNPAKSLNHQGVQSWKVNGINEQALCIDYLHHVTPGTVHPITSGTPKTSVMNKVKLLIVLNYLNINTKQKGKNLAFAIWSYTNHVKAPNSQVQKMINQVKNLKKVIPDVFSKTIGSKIYTWKFSSELQKGVQHVILFTVTSKNKPTPPKVPVVIPIKNNTVYVYVNNTIYLNNTIYINNTVIVNNTINNTIIVNNTCNKTTPPICNNTYINKTCPKQPVCPCKPKTPKKCTPKVPWKDDTCQTKCK